MGRIGGRISKENREFDGYKKRDKRNRGKIKMSFGTNLHMKNTEELKSARARKTSSSKSLGPLYIVLFLLVWAGLVYGGFYYSKQYFDQEIKNIQQTNAMYIQEIKDRMDSLTNELIALKGDLSNTDETISSSSSIHKELNAKIELLDKQLKNLEKSLQILKEAP